MKELKEPKEFRYPRVYVQDGLLHHPNSYTCGARIRIVYPNGKVEWMSDARAKLNLLSLWRNSCYAYQKLFRAPDRRKFKSGSEAVKAMRKYDQEEGFPLAIFAGEIK